MEPGDGDDDFVCGMSDAVEEARDCPENKMENLRVVGKNKALCLDSTNKSKESVVYPDPFKGELGENVYKFREKMETAMVAAQVRDVERKSQLPFSSHCRKMRFTFKLSFWDMLKEVD